LNSVFDGVLSDLILEGGIYTACFLHGCLDFQRLSIDLLDMCPLCWKNECVIVLFWTGYLYTLFWSIPAPSLESWKFVTFS